MKFRLTPLNILAAAGMMLLAMNYLQIPVFTAQGKEFGAFYRLMLAGLTFVAMLIDLIFRFLFRDLKRIWLVELIFLLLTVILFLILQI